MTVQTMTAAPGVSSSPAELKQQGNEYFKEKKFESAVKSYTQALLVAEALGNVDDPRELAKLYCNRAAASAGLNDWPSVERDGRAAVEADGEFVIFDFLITSMKSNIRRKFQSIYFG